MSGSGTKPTRLALSEMSVAGGRPEVAGCAPRSQFDPTATLGRPNDNALDAGFLAIKVFVLAAKIPSPEEWVSAVRSSAKQNIVLA